MPQDVRRFPFSIVVGMNEKYHFFLYIFSLSKIIIDSISIYHCHSAADELCLAVALSSTSFRSESRIHEDDDDVVADDSNNNNIAHRIVYNISIYIVEHVHVRSFVAICSHPKLYKCFCPASKYIYYRIV